jgi:hypothetical protein
VTYDDRESVIQGASYTYTATVRVTASDPLVLAWYTVKANISDADPGVLQKKVTTSNVAGTGQITADGSAAGTATIRFDITSTDTTGLTAQGYVFDVKVKTTSGAFAYGAQGRLQVHRNVTTSTS